MAMRKYGAPATSHVRLITAEDVEITKTVDKEESENTKEKKKKEQHDGNSTNKN